MLYLIIFHALLYIEIKCDKAKLSHYINYLNNFTDKLQFYSLLLTLGY